MGRRCLKCEEYKEDSGFHQSKVYAGGLRSHCKLCRSRESKDYYKLNPDPHKGLRRALNNPYGFWSNHTMASHRHRGFLVNINSKELTELAIKTTYCKYCGVELDWKYGHKNGKPVPNSPSLDRINNGRIVALDTIQIICCQCNLTKQNRTENEFVEYCKNFLHRVLG